MNLRLYKARQDDDTFVFLTDDSNKLVRENLYLVPVVDGSTKYSPGLIAVDTPVQRQSSFVLNLGRLVVGRSPVVTEASDIDESLSVRILGDYDRQMEKYVSDLSGLHRNHMQDYVLSRIRGESSASLRQVRKEARREFELSLSQVERPVLEKIALKYF